MMEMTTTNAARANAVRAASGVKGRVEAETPFVMLKVRILP
ncbi:MAG TPA: hypothetical protein VGA84_16105 [Thermoanaerobaculia bacterium]